MGDLTIDFNCDACYDENLCSISGSDDFEDTSSDVVTEQECVDGGGFWCGDDSTNWVSSAVPDGCVPSNWICDGFHECSDGADEDCSSTCAGTDMCSSPVAELELELTFAPENADEILAGGEGSEAYNEFASAIETGLSDALGLDKDLITVVSITAKDENRRQNRRSLEDSSSGLVVEVMIEATSEDMEAAGYDNISAIAEEVAEQAEDSQSALNSVEVFDSLTEVQAEVQATIDEECNNGDFDGDGSMNVLDVVGIVYGIMNDESVFVANAFGCIPGDFDDDGTVNVLDVVGLVYVILNS